MMYLIDEYTQHVRRAIQLCLQHSLVLPVLALLYSAIDVLGFLASANACATQRSFEAWTGCYMPKFLAKKGINGGDLYSARCGILHTGKAASDMVNSGKAVELWYEFRGDSHINRKIASSRRPILLDVDEMVAAFNAGVDEFLKDVASDPTVQARAVTKAERFFRRGLLTPLR